MKMEREPLSVPCGLRKHTTMDTVQEIKTSRPGNNLNYNKEKTVMIQPSAFLYC